MAILDKIASTQSHNKMTPVWLGHADSSQGTVFCEKKIQSYHEFFVVEREREGNHCLIIM